jgi:biopolymer transport protein ExbB/TolQ
MDAFSTVVKFFQDCGLFIYPSALIMALGIAISIERFLFLSKARNQNRKVWAQVLPMLQKGQFRDVQGVTSHSDAAVGKIVNYGLTRMQSPGRREDYDAAMEEGMMEIVPRLEKRTHYIATFANVITLVGLLGTIIGLIKGFTAVAQVNPAEKAEMLSASISIAMNNTAFALMVAIPFLLIHSFLQAKTSEIVDGLEAAKISFLNLVGRVRSEMSRMARTQATTSSPFATQCSTKARPTKPPAPVISIFNLSAPQFRIAVCSNHGRHHCARDRAIYHFLDTNGSSWQDLTATSRAASNRAPPRHVKDQWRTCDHDRVDPLQSELEILVYLRPEVETRPLRCSVVRFLRLCCKRLPTFLFLVPQVSRGSDRQHKSSHAHSSRRHIVELGPR